MGYKQHFFHTFTRTRLVGTTVNATEKIPENKAKAISAELLKFNLKNKMEKIGKKRGNGNKWEEKEKLEEKNTENQKKLDYTERNRKKQEDTGRNSKRQ